MAVISAGFRQKINNPQLRAGILKGEANGSPRKNFKAKGRYLLLDKLYVSWNIVVKENGGENPWWMMIWYMGQGWDSTVRTTEIHSLNRTLALMTLFIIEDGSETVDV